MVNNITMNPLDPTILALAIVVTAVIFAAAAWWTRATPRRIVGALVGTIPLILLVSFYDNVAAMGLIGWRIIRRFRTPGLFSFLVLLGLLGVI